MRPRQKLHTSDLAYTPAVHVFTDEPFKATDEHTPLIFLKDDQPKAFLPCLLMSYPRPAIGQCRTQSVTFSNPFTQI